MPAPGEVQLSATPSRAWYASCAAVCLAILAFAVFGNGDASPDLAYQLGHDFTIAIFIAGALHIAFRKRESNRTSWIAFGLIYASLIAASVIASNRQKTGLRQVASEIQQTVAAVQSSIVSGSASPPPIQTAAAGTTVSAKIGVVIKTMMNRMLAQRREYELELEAIGWSKLLDGQRLRNDSSLAESRTILQQAKVIVAKYRSRTNDVFIQVRRDIENSDLTANSKQSMLSGFDDSAQQGQAQAMELWSLEEQVLSQIENAFNLLGAKRSGWQIQDGQVVFHRQADLDLFNSYMSQVQILVAKQQKLQAASLQRTQESLIQLGK